MPLSKELQELLDSVEFGDTTHKQAFTELLEKDEKAAQAFQAGVMKEKDYRQKTQAIADTRKKLEQEQETWNQQQDTYLNTLNTYKGDMEKRLNDALTQVSKAKVYGAALETKIQKLAAEYGADPEELLSDVKEMRGTTKEPEKPAFDDAEFSKKYIPRDEFQKVGDQFFSYPVMLRDLEREYQRLYGKEYEGSLQELVKEATVQVNQMRSRGQETDLFGYMRNKLDFEGQKSRNAEKAKSDGEAERKSWEEKTRKELETQVRSEYLASNPTAMRQPESPDAWRQNLSAAGRKQNNTERPRTTQETFKRQQDFHKAYEERAAKRDDSAAA